MDAATPCGARLAELADLATDCITARTCSSRLDLEPEGHVGVEVDPVRGIGPPSVVPALSCQYGPVRMMWVCAGDAVRGDPDRRGAPSRTTLPW